MEGEVVWDGRRLVPLGEPLEPLGKSCQRSVYPDADPNDNPHQTLPRQPSLLGFMCGPLPRSSGAISGLGSVKFLPSGIQIEVVKLKNG